MEKRYKIILSNKYLFKEAELPENANGIKVGTGINCDIRLRKDMFFEQFELIFVKNNTKWTVTCSDNVYITTGDIRKFVTKELAHGDMIEIKYQDTDVLIFNLEFLIDFEYGNKRYERMIHLEKHSQINIGSNRFNHIILKSSYTKEEEIKLIKQQNDLLLDIKHSVYGVYVNGRKANGNTTIKEGDFWSISDYFFYYYDNMLWTERRDDIEVQGLKFDDEIIPKDYPKFNRSTRVKTTVGEKKIEILDPPSIPQKPKNNLMMRLLPSLGMVVASGVMAFMGGRMIFMSVLSGGMAVFTTVIGIREGKNEYKNNLKQRKEIYTSYIQKKREEIDEERIREKDELETIYISQEREKEWFSQFHPRLFERVPGDEDYLCVRLGSGDVKAKRTIEYKKQEKLETEDELQLIPSRVADEYEYLQDAPVVCDFKSNNAIGIVGNIDNQFSILKNIVVDIIARQYYTDVKVVFIVEEKNKERVQWLRFLPHVYNEITGCRNIVCDDESKNLVFEYLYKELTEREQKKAYSHNLILFFYDEYGLKKHPISKFVEKAKDIGVTFVFFGENEADIPQGCGHIILATNDKNAMLINSQDKLDSVAFTYPTIRDEDVKEIVKLVAPVYTEEISLEGSLTKNITLFELLNIMSVDDLDLEGRWNQSQVFKSMAAPLGVSKTGEVSLDLHDKAHGPHGLVAGTTGSGKSEILQTYILSMATLYHPYEVSFVIIDFKGGGMVNQFKELPHLLGAITNIDGKEINRSLKSIKAELQKRQRLFAEADVNHIDKYIRKYKAGEVSTPLPHLIIIVDEFAELKAEQPEFMKELISAARIGRSLGVHLILATQKPSGQVNEQIWSNSRFKLCLKVQSQEDSNEVLKSPLAAEIKEPGRAYLQVGNNEIFELFQSAYSGASETADDSKEKEFTIYEVAESGKRIPVYEKKKKSAKEGGSTQLDAIVRCVAQFCEEKNLPKLSDICLPPLTQCIEYESMRTQNRNIDRYDVEIGIYDDPDNQYQGEYTVDVGSNNLMIIGSSQSGKTNLLQNMIRSLSSKYSPEEVTIYAIDFGSMVLKNFDKLNHVGGVVCPSEDEKLKNLFKLLYAEIEERKEKLISIGVSSFAAYKESGKKDMPLIVLMIDNLTALKELYFKDDDELLNLCRDGLTVGISVIIANAQTAGIGYKYLSNFSSRIAFYCNDSNEYSSLFDHCRERIDSIPGRCIVKLENSYYECQSYLAFKGEKEIERVQAIREYIADVNQANKNMRARKIPVIPSSLVEEYMGTEFAGYMQDRFNIVAGLNYATVTPMTLNLANLGLLAITGREKSGKHNWVRYTVNMIDQMYPEQLKLYIADGINKKLSSLKGYHNLSGYSIIAEDAVTYIKEIEAIMQERYEALLSGDESILTSSELVMFIIDNQDALLAICNDSTALASYKNITGKYKNMNVCIIAFIDNVNIPYSAPEIMKNIRDSHHMMFFDDIANMKIFDVPLVMARNFKKPIEIGDGYYMKDNECIKLKTAVSTQRRKE